MKGFKYVPVLAVAVWVFGGGCGTCECDDLCQADALIPADTLQDTGDGQVAADTGEPDSVTDVPSTDGLDDSVSDDVPGDVSADVPFCPDCERSDPIPLYSWRERQAEYLNFCAENNGPEAGNSYGQVCRVKTGQSVVPAAIASAVEDLTLREDCSDFRASALVRMLYIDRENGALDETSRQTIIDTLLAYKYWMTEVNPEIPMDKMCYWSENHQILFHSSEYLAGQMFPDAVFSNVGMTGAEHRDHARPLILKWLNLRGAIGFSEWHSNVYFNEDIPALVNLVDFAEDPEIRTKAAMVLDIIAYDMAMNSYRGYFAATHGRTYEDELINGLNDHTTEAGWMFTGLGDYNRTGAFAAVFLASSDNYFVPDIIETLARQAANGEFEHRQRDSIDIADGPEWGLTYDQDDDVPTWAGFSAIAAPETINGMLAFVDKYNLWEGFLFGDLPDYLVELVKQNIGTPEIVTLATDADVVSRGIALQSVNTYTFRTPDYQISAAQDYNPGYWGAQTLMWQATLDGDAVVVTSLPTTVELGGDSVEVAGEWVGSWHPRATVYRNAAVIQYRADSIPDLLAGFFKPKNSHAFFRRAAFAETREIGNWVMGRLGNGYIALYSKAPTHWSTENEYELATDVQDNTWLVQLGSTSEFGSFDDFADAVSASAVQFDEEGRVEWDSPSVGIVTVGWTGPFMVEGREVDLGPYKRFENSSADVDFGSRVTRIRSGDRTLELDFANGTRKVVKHQ
ncbi:MAG TPA: hypothetical protein PLY68_07420 [Myxococcota bacterium]|nr:hypothetical protein [Myxococcota bacterium]HOD08699.1 hypothetical protein [Myxococcota bacterium]HPB50986.1 hypothetical protein [Myxococcota bacterium]HQP96008.1 hypothetical protein [Myxococcota bacterium]